MLFPHAAMLHRSDVLTPDIDDTQNVEETYVDPWTERARMEDREDWEE